MGKRRSMACEDYAEPGSRLWLVGCCELWLDLCYFMAPEKWCVSELPPISNQEETMETGRALTGVW